MIFRKYEARHISGKRYIVNRHRFFGQPDSRIAVWDGYDFDLSRPRQKPDWFWESIDEKMTTVMVKGRIRRALLREFERVMGREPAGWAQIPPSRIIKMLSEES